MKHSILYSAIAAAMAIGLAACSSGSDVAGIGGSGITATGTITGFGSVILDDVKFETSSSTFDVDDNPDSTEDALALGMRVTIKGTLNADGVTGTADSITYDDELQGPVSDPVNDVDADNKTITVLGITVALNRNTTRFDTDEPIAGTFDFDSIAQGNNIEISGYLNSSNQLVATRVELEDETFDFNNDTVEVRGTVSNLISDNFTLNLLGISSATVNVVTSPGTEYELTGELSDGILVEVEGKCTDANCDTIDAKSVEEESEGFEDDGDVEIKGFITRYDSDSNFDVDGLLVDASNAQFEPASLVLAQDMFVEVEGTVTNNVLIATKVELED